MDSSVSLRSEGVTLPTYLPLPPDKNPMFLEKRVYQGSSGRVYPLPFTDRISVQPVHRVWQGIWIENEYLRALILPEIGGRIHVLQDKTSGYDLIYRQEVIKPALVGLAGPWISGGIEFNWPQHHRPATFLPVETHVEEGEDGSKTVWCGDHDPMQRMKAMHGVCLRPGVARLELRVRVHNRTLLPQTFLWWANVATRVHESYQSFFPSDVCFVADHAKRAMSRFPLCDGHYYGVNYGMRSRTGVPADQAPSKYLPPSSGGHTPPTYSPNDLSFYANIPVPTSYMAMGSRENFFGGYDHREEAGIIHWANHHISPGKKQWTWGNHGFGYAWDHNLTDPDQQGESAPYIELMAGVYTDNQPDFSFLQPGETKTWVQNWAPLTKIGPPLYANAHAALSLTPIERGVRLGVSVFAPVRGGKAVVQAGKKTIAEVTGDLAPGISLLHEFALPPKIQITDLTVRVETKEGKELIAYQKRLQKKEEVPPPASEPPPPSRISSNDELFITGLHLSQYRHATRSPEPYWREAVRRDPGDSRCQTALGDWHFRRGEFSSAEKHFRQAIRRLTLRNPNPADGEAFYLLGLTLTHRSCLEEAYDHFYKATWSQAWAGAAHLALADLDCFRQRWGDALDHLDRALRLDSDHLRVRGLRGLVLRRIGKQVEAEECFSSTARLDPLDGWSRYFLKGEVCGDAQACLDLAHDLARAGFFAEAITLLEKAPKASGDLPTQNWGTAPLVAYTLGWLYERNGQPEQARRFRKSAAKLPLDYCFPCRLEEIAVLESALVADPRDARAHYYLGNLLYDRRRHREGLYHWEIAAKLDPSLAVVWRNLGIAYFNVAKKNARARSAYDRACQAAPQDARILFERDQLWKKLGISPVRRLRVLEKKQTLVRQRDDLSVELCALYNQTGQPHRALPILQERRFQPWEGGEGQVMAQHVRCHLLLGRAALAKKDVADAIRLLEQAAGSPENLGEAKHLLANPAEILFWLGEVRSAAGDLKAAKLAWTRAATYRGDFMDMTIRSFSEMTCFSALAYLRLGLRARAVRLARELLAYASRLEKEKARIDYFATSLPAMLIFDEDIQRRQITTAKLLQGQAWMVLGKKAKARALLAEVMRRDPNHGPALDFLALC